MLIDCREKMTVLSLVAFHRVRKMIGLIFGVTFLYKYSNVTILLYSFGLIVGYGERDQKHHTPHLSQYHILETKKVCSLLVLYTLEFSKLHGPFAPILNKPV